MTDNEIMTDLIRWLDDAERYARDGQFVASSMLLDVCDEAADKLSKGQRNQWKARIREATRSMVLAKRDWSKR